MQVGRQLWRVVAAWRHREHGISEVAAAILVIPLMIALIFTLIEVGINLNYRNRVDSIVQDALRGVSHDGAVYDQRTYTGPPAYAAPGEGWQAWGLQQLQDLCGPDRNRCDGGRNRVTFTCTPVELEQEPGGVAACTANFPYRPVTGSLLDNPVMNLGFGGLWGDDIRVRMESITTVGYGY